MDRSAHFHALSAAIGVALLAAAAPSSAATALRAPSAAGVAHCQAALPAFEGQIRKRPLAIQNEGIANAFVSCALPTEGTAMAGTSRVFLYLVGSPDAPTTVNCTLVSGLTGSPGLAYFAKSVTVPTVTPGNGTLIDWLPVDNAGNNFNRWVQVSCSIPPGVGIGHLGKTYDVEIGA